MHTKYDVCIGVFLKRGGAMSQNETVSRILHAAILLFSERGFAETSLRTITGMADVNLASVNYHFGSKKELIQAVCAHFLRPFCDELNASLDGLEKQLEGQERNSPETKVVLTCMFDALFKSTAEIHESPERFMRLLGLAYTQTQEHLRHYIVQEFGQTYHRFIILLGATQPQLDPVVFYWRLHFLLGAGVFTLSSYEAIHSMLNSGCSSDISIEKVVEMMTSSMEGILLPPSV